MIRRKGWRIESEQEEEDGNDSADVLIPIGWGWPQSVGMLCLSPLDGHSPKMPKWMTPKPLKGGNYRTTGRTRRTLPYLVPRQFKSSLLAHFASTCEKSCLDGRAGKSAPGCLNTRLSRNRARVAANRLSLISSSHPASASIPGFKSSQAYPFHRHRFIDIVTFGIHIFVRLATQLPSFLVFSPLTIYPPSVPYRSFSTSLFPNTNLAISSLYPGYVAISKNTSTGE